MLLFEIIKLLPTLRLSSGGSHEWKYENTGFGVHEWNEIRSYTEKKSNFLFLLCFYLQ